jgi:DNA primase
VTRLADRPPEERYGFRRQARHLKAAVPIEVYAGTLTGLRPAGEGRLVGLCPLHEERTPSFYVFSDPEDPHFHCYGCSAHGDVLDLFVAVEGHDERWTALVALAQRYGVELPGRPERWHRWSSEKGRRREALVEVVARSYQRRFFRWWFAPSLADIEDDEEREKEARRVFADLWDLSLACARSREAGRP